MNILEQQTQNCSSFPYWCAQCEVFHSFPMHNMKNDATNSKQLNFQCNAVKITSIKSSGTAKCISDRTSFSTKFNLLQPSISLHSLKVAAFSQFYSLFWFAKSLVKGQIGLNDLLFSLFFRPKILLSDVSRKMSANLWESEVGHGGDFLSKSLRC